MPVRDRRSDTKSAQRTTVLFMKRDNSRRRWGRYRREAVGCAAQAGRRERSGSRPCRDGCRPRAQRAGPSAPPAAARLDPLEPSSAVGLDHW
jgi:hypothetical protein